MDFGELAVAAGLLLVAELGRARAVDGFAVGDSRRVKSDFNLEVLLQARDHQVHILIAHAGDDGLFRFRIAVDDDGGIFILQALEAGAELVFFTFRHGGNRVEGRGLRIFDGAELDGNVAGGENVGEFERFEPLFDTD